MTLFKNAAEISKRVKAFMLNSSGLLYLSTVLHLGPVRLGCLLASKWRCCCW